MFMMVEFLIECCMNIFINFFVFVNELFENSQNQIILFGGEVYCKQSIIFSFFENDMI